MSHFDTVPAYDGWMDGFTIASATLSIASMLMRCKKIWLGCLANGHAVGAGWTSEQETFEDDSRQHDCSKSEQCCSIGL